MMSATTFTRNNVSTLLRTFITARMQSTSASLSSLVKLEEKQGSSLRYVSS